MARWSPILGALFCFFGCTCGDPPPVEDLTGLSIEGTFDAKEAFRGDYLPIVTPDATVEPAVLTIDSDGVAVVKVTVGDDEYEFTYQATATPDGVYRVETIED